MFGIKTAVVRYIKTYLPPDDSLKYIRLNPIGYACNHACPMCWRLQLSAKERLHQAQLESSHLTITDYQHLIASLPKSVQEITLVGGGEPLLYKHINKLFTYIKVKSIKGLLITNGTYLDASIIQTLVALSWDRIRISFHAATKKTYKEINGADDYDTVIRNIKSLLKIRGTKKIPKISLLFVIQKGNYTEIPAFISLAQRLHVDEIEFDYVMHTDKKILLSPSIINKVIHVLTSIQDTVQIENNISDIVTMFSIHPKWNRKITKSSYLQDKYCHIVQSNLEISANGTVVPCCIAWGKIPSYSLKTSPIAKIWASYKPFRRQLAAGTFQKFCIESCNYPLEKRPFQRD